MSDIIKAEIKNMDDIGLCCVYPSRSNILIFTHSQISESFNNNVNVNQITKSDLCDLCVSIKKIKSICNNASQCSINILDSDKSSISIFDHKYIIGFICRFLEAFKIKYKYVSNCVLIKSDNNDRTPMLSSYFESNTNNNITFYVQITLTICLMFTLNINETK